MIEADRVLSTPEANPRSEPSAESLDSCCHQPGVGQPGSGIRAGDSPMPRKDKSSSIVSFPKSKKPLPADRPSAMASVQCSGLRLVDRETSIGEPATHEQLAAMEFEPWAGKSEGTPGLTGENWMEHRISVVFAHATMFMSKRELINLHRDVDQDHVDQLMANISETAEWLKAVAFMMEGAQARLIASACAAVDEGVIGDGTLPLHIAEVRSTPRAMGL